LWGCFILQGQILALQNTQCRANLYPACPAEGGTICGISGLQKLCTAEALPYKINHQLSRKLYYFLETAKKPTFLSLRARQGVAIPQFLPQTAGSQ